jgi:tripartite-type tricarboxylate transporter receptor subunit TctC
VAAANLVVKEMSPGGTQTEAAMKAGKIKALAVTSKQPHAAFPDLPPLATVAPGFAVEIWVGVFAPAGTPPALVERLNQEINAIAASAELAPVLEPDGTLPEAISAAAFAVRIRDEFGQWKQIATEHKVVAE